MIESLYEVPNGSKPLSAIFLDLQNTFDMMDDKILLQKLNNIGLRGPFNNIFDGKIR